MNTVSVAAAIASVACAIQVRIERDSPAIAHPTWMIIQISAMAPRNANDQ